MSWKLPPFLIASLLGLASLAGAQSRRAVLVGIDQYNPSRGTAPAAKPATQKRAPVEGNPTYWQFEDLDGAKHDVELMEGILRSFGIDDIVTLKDQEATADAVLSALEKHLVTDAKAGDVRIFYYSGHGNHIPNNSSKELGGEDQTIVPADHWRDVPDIRDKEISRILFRAAQKGVKVTFIADSCHSASLSRGSWNNRGKARTTKGPRDRDPERPGVVLKAPAVNDPADIDPKTGKPIDPAAAGVLFLAAAQQNEEALEARSDDGQQHGAFTWALKQALTSPTEPVDQVFQRLVARLRGSASAQMPVIEGTAERRAQGIFGDKADSAGLTIAVQTAGDKIRVRGGTAVGVYPGARFKSLAKPEIELEITASDGISASFAKVIGAGKPKPGDLFRIDRLVVPNTPSLMVYIPEPAPAQALNTTAREIAKLRDDPRIQWMADATVDKPSRIMHWTGNTWILEQNPAAGQPQDLGAQPTAAAVRKLLPDHAKFLLMLPPTTELNAALKPGEGAYAGVKRTGQGKQNTPSGAQYWFAGRLNGDALEYAWILPDATEDSVRKRAGEQKGASRDGYLPLPIRTEWIELKGGAEGVKTAAADLMEKTEGLARIRNFFALPASSDGGFPYHLELRHAETGAPYQGGDLKDGENYKLVLTADPKVLEHPEELGQRWVYVFVINHHGESDLVFGQSGNHLPYTLPGQPVTFAQTLPLGDDTITISEPFGVDSYFLLTTEDPIDNPEAVLQWKAVRSRGAPPPVEFKNPLSDLLHSAGAGSRGVGKPVPSKWSIEVSTYRSVEKN